MGVGCFDWSLGRPVGHVHGSNGFGRCGLFIGPGALSPQIAPRGGFSSVGEGVGLSIQDMGDEVGFRDGLCVRLAGNRGAGADAVPIRWKSWM